MSKALRHISLPCLGILLGFLMIVQGCGNIVLPDKDGLLALREAKTGGKVISIEGKVESETGSPLEGIDVQIIGIYYMSSRSNNDGAGREINSLSTDESGIYRMPVTTVYHEFEDLKIIASDRNDVYARDSVVVLNVKVGSVAPTIILKKK